jgi:hypothetical protein
MLPCSDVDMRQQASTEPLSISIDVRSFDLVGLQHLFGSIRSHSSVMISIQHPLNPIEDAC